MDTSALKKFAQSARRQLIAEVTTRLDGVLNLDSGEHREQENAIRALQAEIKAASREAVIDRVAYIWFNRLCAFRFMDVNGYTRPGIVSPAEGSILPEILQEAKQGHVDDEFRSFLRMDRITGFLNGTLPSADPQQEAYRLLLVAACNRYHQLMPFLFQRIDDYTELLMPRDLLSESSILTDLREVLSGETCQDVEVIGWLYQFYISEKKDEVFDGLKKNKKVTAENIPAATQLFTPHWIVRYLVENSLGRLWMLNHPSSGLTEKMEYYIRLEEPETDFLKVASVEDLKLCDPACGSGHMLTYAFDLLYAIYEEEGYQPSEIPSLILKNNLFGVEIDERAGELAAFALTMKARERDRRFLTRGVKPSVCVLENVQFAPAELEAQDWFRDSGPLKADLYHDLNLFHEGKHFGSLLRPVLPPERIREYRNRVAEKPEAMQNLGLMDEDVRNRALRALTQAEYLSSRYHVVVANPPYMGGGNMNSTLKAFAKDEYPDSKADLFAMFMERNLDLAMGRGNVAMITMQSWMFLSSFETLRGKLLEQDTLLSMTHLGARAFDSIGGEVVQTTAFVLGKNANPTHRGTFLRLVDGNSEAEKQKLLRNALKPDSTNNSPLPANNSFHASAADLKKIPGAPIAYWAKEEILSSFARDKLIGDIAQVKIGMGTGKNAIFVRDWWEVDRSQIDFSLCDVSELDVSKARYFPYNKGGDYRLWYGNLQQVLWFNSAGRNYMDTMSGHRENGGWNYYFKQGLTWSFISSSKFGVRLLPNGFTFDVAGSTLFVEDTEIKYVLGFLSSKVCFDILSLLNPTMNYQAGNIKCLPIKLHADSSGEVTKIIESNISLSRNDWDSYETSWDFTDLPLLRGNFRRSTLAETYSALREHWLGMTLEMQRLEEENNRIFIEAYGLQDELTPDVPLEEITLTCNPHYRYGNNKTDEELEALLLADTMKEFISYAVGCMFGRYSLDKPGLVLANQGETVEDYLAQVPHPTFPPDEDNVIPILEGEWFSDDITERFKKFLRITFGEEHYRENLEFIEVALGKDVRKYFLKDFYSDHVKRYKKRPIYWLFSSPKGGFNALIYMHRYRPDTASVVLNGYLRDFRLKLKSRVDHLQRIEANPSTTKADQTRALKETEKIKKLLRELDDYERDVLFPLAAEQVEIDLDDGVKSNYPKFGKALKPIKGLNA